MSCFSSSWFSSVRRVNNSGDISWHKNRVFISEVFRFEELAFELITPGVYRVFFETWRPENSMWKIFGLELHGEWSEFADECIGLLATVEEMNLRKPDLRK
jgi:hypothetical protein